MAVDLERPNVYLKFEGVETPIVPEISFFRESKPGIRRRTQNSEVGLVDIDDSRVINQIARTLRDARTDRYVSLAASQPFVRAGEVSLETMEKLLHDLDEHFWNYDIRNSIFGELVDFQPQLRFPNYRFPKEKNAVLYRGPWRVNGDNGVGRIHDHHIDITAMDPERDLVPVVVSKAARPLSNPMSRRWRDVTNASRGSILFSMLGYSIERNSYPGIEPIHWAFNQERPVAFIESISGSGIGALLGSRSNIEEVLERYDKYEKAQRILEEKNRKAKQLAQQRRFYLTPSLQNILLSQEETIWEEELRVWDRAAQETEAGNFSLEDKLQVELEYGKFQSLALTDHKEYADFVQAVEREAKRPKLMAGLTPPVVINMQERQEAAYTAYEDLVLLDYLTRVAKRGEEIGKRLVTVENLSMGLYAVEPIRHRLEEKGITILEAYMSSGRGSKRDIPEQLGPLIRSEQPLIAVVDGTKSVDALGVHPGSFGRLLAHIQAINSVLERPYVIGQWNPDGKTVAIPPLDPLSPLDPAKIDEHTFLLINYTLSGENVPDWLREEVGVNHQPGFFDDWKKLNEGEFFFNNFGLQRAFGRDTIIQLLRSGVETYLSRNILERFNF